MKIYTGSRVEEVFDTKDDKTVVVFQRKGKKEYITGAKVLMSTGRSPNFSVIDLKNWALN